MDDIRQARSWPPTAISSDWTGWAAVDTLNSVFNHTKPVDSGIGWTLVDAPTTCRRTRTPTKSRPSTTRRVQEGVGSGLMPGPGEPGDGQILSTRRKRLRPLYRTARVALPGGPAWSTICRRRFRGPGLIDVSSPSSPVRSTPLWVERVGQVDPDQDPGWCLPRRPRGHDHGRRHHDGRRPHHAGQGQGARLPLRAPEPGGCSLPLSVAENMVIGHGFHHQCVGSIRWRALRRQTRLCSTGSR